MFEFLGALASILAPVLGHFPWTQFALPAVAFTIVIATDILLRLRSTEVVRKGE